jgi:hypothetical protein
VDELDTSADRWISFAWLMTVPLLLVEWVLLFVILPKAIRAPDLSQLSGVFLPGVGGNPEPLEQSRYVFGISAAFLLYAAAALVYRWWAKRHPPAGPRISLVLTLAIVAIQGLFCAVARYLWLLNSQDRLHYFTRGFLEGAAILAVLILLVFLFAAPKGLAESRGRLGRLVPRILALGFAAVGLLPAIHTSANIAHAHETLLYHTSFILEDFAAVLSGRTPLVDYAPQYQSFFPFLFTPFFRVIGLSFTSFSVTMALLSFAELALAYAILKQISRSDWAAMVLFIPFAAIGFHAIPESPAPDELVYSFNLNMGHPLRTFGPWLVAFLCARYLASPSARKMNGIFLVGAFCTVNNVDFSFPAFFASLVVMLATADVGLFPSLRKALRILLRAILATAGSVFVFSIICLARSGHLPDFRHWLDVQRNYVLYGLGMLPMPDRGVYWIVFATFLATLVVALFGLARDESPGPSLPRERHGMLLFSGIFGFGAAMYYVGRSHPYSLNLVLPFWGFSLSLLVWEAFTTWKPSPTRRRFWISVLPAMLLLGNLSICASEVVHTLSPIGQIERLAGDGTPFNPAARFLSPLGPVAGLSPNVPIYADKMAAMADFVRQRSAPGERVVISYPYGHLIGIEAGVDNVYPFGVGSELVTYAQLDEVMKAVGMNRVNRVFGTIHPEVARRLAAQGFRRVDVLQVGGVHVFGAPFELWEQPPTAGRRSQGVGRTGAARRLFRKTKNFSATKLTSEATSSARKPAL